MCIRDRLDTIINNAKNDLICIYCAIGQKRSSIAQVVQTPVSYTHLGFLGARRLTLEGYPRAGALVDEEEQAGLWGDGDLGVIAGGFKLAVAVEERLVQLIGALDGRAQYGRSHAVKCAAAGVEHQQALGGKDLSIELRKRLGEGVAGLVSSRQRIHRL